MDWAVSQGDQLAVWQRTCANGCPMRPVVHPTMPIQDAIDLVHFLIDTTCGYVRFAPGPATVAQPIDSAAITRHEGFRWVRRKHYFSAALNHRTP